MRKLLAVLALVATSQALAAGVPAGWQRISSPDGRVSVATPCAAADLDRFEQGDGWRIICNKGGLLFIATSGVASLDDGRVLTYDEQLGETLKALGPSAIDQTPIKGYRAYALPCPDMGGAPCLFQVDFIPGRPLLLAVVGERGPGSADASKTAENAEAARQFLQTLELKAK